MSSSFDAPQDQPGRHRLVHKRTSALTPPRAAGFLVAASLTVLGITAIHQDLSKSGPDQALSGPGAMDPGSAAGQVPRPAYDNNAPALEAPAPDAPTPAQFLAQNTESPRPQPANNAAGTPSSKAAGAPGGQSTARQAPSASAGAPAPVTSNPAAAQPPAASGPASGPPPSTASSSPTTSSPSTSRPAPALSTPLSQVVGTVTGVLGGL